MPEKEIMMNDFLTRDPMDSLPILREFSSDWSLLTAGNAESANCMTVSWGGVGVLWGKPAACVFVRPSRRTHALLAEGLPFSLSFFGSDYRKNLTYCGKVSGKDENKMKNAGFTFVPAENGSLFPAEARKVLLCSPLFAGSFDPGKIPAPLLPAFYPKGDFHSVFIGEIVGIKEKKTD